MMFMQLTIQNRESRRGKGIQQFVGFLRLGSAAEVIYDKDFVSYPPTPNFIWHTITIGSHIQSAWPQVLHPLRSSLWNCHFIVS